MTDLNTTHLYNPTPNQQPGVGPDQRDPAGHFQLCGTNQRVLVIVDLGGVIQVGGVDVTNPDHLDETAARLAHLALRLRMRQTAATVRQDASA